MSVKTIGQIENGPAETVFKWKIDEFFSIAERRYIKYLHNETDKVNFNGGSWYFRLYLRSEYFPGMMNLRLYCSGMPLYDRYTIEYSFGLEKADGSAEKVITGTVTEENRMCERCVFPLSEIQERKSVLAPLDVLTVTCKLKFLSPLYSWSEAEVMYQPKPKKLRKLDSLSENFRSLFINQENCDITLQVMDKKYKAHRTVLIARSPVFAAMFQHETLEKQTGVISITDCEPDSFKLFLEFLYCGKLEDLSTEDTLYLYEISNKYDVLELKMFCVEFMAENLSAEYLGDVMILANKYNDTRLLYVAQDYFYENLNQILKTSEWDTFVKENYDLSKQLLEELSMRMKIVW